MEATRICTTKDGILYIDEHYQTWIFKHKDGKFLPLQKGKPIAEYINEEFGSIKKDVLSRLTTVAMSAITAREPIKLPYFYPHIHVIDNVEEGLSYYEASNDMPLHDQILFKPLLCNLETYDVTKVNEIRYDDEGAYFYICEGADNVLVEDVELLTNDQIDSLKSGALAEDPEWYLKITRRILCYSCGSETTPDTYLWFFYGYDPETGNLLDNDNGQFDVCRNYRPVTDQELDSFKISL